ncbi:hypothetical protein AX16_009904 [Volvariella volvacea WC 439]|nr:hypothetical protein AX16_009904 [Volvariella volvacea WC 439]
MDGLDDYLTAISSWTHTIKEDFSNPKLSISPLTCFDKHVDGQLALAMVRPLPEIVSLLLRVCETTVSSYRAKYSNVEPPDLAEWQWARSFSVTSANTTVINHQLAAFAFHQCTSTLLFHPENFSETPVIVGDNLWDRETSEDTATGTLRMHYRYDQNGGDSITASTKQKMDELEKYYPNLAIWYFLSSSDRWHEQFIRQLGGSRARKPRWTTPQTSGHVTPIPIPPHALPPDAPVSPWSSLLRNEPVSTRSTRMTVLHSSHFTFKNQSDLAAVTTPALPKYRCAPSRAYRPQVDDYLQRAWSHAIREDATFLIFHCGKYERIGIRHRASQTLYLSDVIDTTKFDLYGKLQIGLYIAIIQDAMSRLEERLKQAKVDNPSDRILRKRKRKTSPLRESKRRKGRGAPPSSRSMDKTHEPSLEEMKAMTSTRKLALVNFCNERYLRSPRPASYIRREVIHTKGRLIMTNFTRSKARNKYSTLDCITVTVGNRIGSGACGRVHEAVLSLKDNGSTYLFRKAVVKFLLKDLAKWKSEREYWIYQHLDTAKVAGIPTVFGLFQDPEEGWMMLVLSHTGHTLSARKASLKAEERLVSQTERDAFIRILEEIHQAGVRHRDLRWGNMTIDDDGLPYIIDFNASHLDVAIKPAETKQETKRLEMLLNGDEGANKISITLSDLDTDTLDDRIRSLPKRLRHLISRDVDTDTDSDSNSQSDLDLDESDESTDLNSSSFSSSTDSSN